MNTRLKAQIVKELLSVLRDPKNRFILIGPPLLQLLVFAFAATLEVNNVKIAVLDQDAGRWSHELIARVGAASFIDEIVVADRPAALTAMIDRRQVLVALRFPPDFSRDIAAGRTATAQVLVDGRRANGGQIATGYLDAIAADLGKELKAAGGAGGTPPQALVRHWFNPNLTYRWFILPGLVAILSMLSSMIVCALSIARERELGTFDQLLVSPAKPLEVVVGKTVPALLVGTALGSLMIAAGVFLFRIPFTGSVILLAPSLMLFILSVVGIGLMVSSVCQTQQQAILGTFAIAIPLILTCGFNTPVENMPGWLQVFAEANPVKHFLIIVEGSFTKALPATAVLDNAWPMVLIAGVTLSAAVALVRRALG